MANTGPTDGMEGQGDIPPAPSPATFVQPQRQGHRGRPSLYNAERAEKIVAALRAGNTRKNAAVYGGIKYETLREWELAFSDFAQEIQKAESDCEVRNVAIVQKAAGGYPVSRKTTKTKTYMRDKVKITETEETEVTTFEFSWQAAAWWLERRRSDDYKLKQATDVTTNGESLPVIGFAINPPSAGTTNREE